MFVYGTLRGEGKATHYLDGYAMFHVQGKKFDFPFIQAMEGYGDVQGNIIEVDDEGLTKLDKYEGVDRGMYKRIKVRAFMGSHLDSEEVWVYVAGPALAYPLIESGDWLNRGD